MSLAGPLTIANGLLVLPEGPPRKGAIRCTAAASSRWATLSPKPATRWSRPRAR